MLFDSIVYGPIHSRRLGVSLGMNLMPTTAKLCTFDCVYCEGGWCNLKSIRCYKSIFKTCKSRETPRISRYVEESKINVDAFVLAAQKVNGKRRSLPEKSNIISVDLVGKRFKHSSIGTGRVSGYDKKHLFITLDNGKMIQVLRKNKNYTLE